MKDELVGADSCLCPICGLMSENCRCETTLGKPLMKEPSPLDVIDVVRSDLNAIVSKLEGKRLSGVVLNDLVLLRVESSMYKCLASFKHDMAEVVRELAEIGDDNVQS